MWLSLYSERRPDLTRFKSAQTDRIPPSSPPKPLDHHHGVPVRRRRGSRRRFKDLHRDVRREQSVGQDHAGDGKRVDVQIGIGA